MLFKFKPILKQVLWGGEKIISFKGIASELKSVGESWEISGVKGSESQVAEGPYAGMSLNALVQEMKDELVGRENYKRFGQEFPLLVKFIDAAKDLSIQVHPSDEVALRQGFERGKTEMWYVINSSGGKIFDGFNVELSKEQYMAKVEEHTICDALFCHEAKAGDVFFLPAGRVHSIGAGCFLAEIQQSSDVTWRIYDYDRKDENGRPRELHLEQAAEAIDFHVEENYLTEYARKKNEGVVLASCPYFNTAIYDLDEPMTLDYSELDAFVVLIAVEGEGSIIDSQGAALSFHAGETVLIPAAEPLVKIEGRIKFLESYV